MAHMVEYLLSKCEALSPIPSAEGRGKKGEKVKRGQP
jgi:hypothetical protein